jgi:hypothetical protein
MSMPSVPTIAIVPCPMDGEDFDSINMRDPFLVLDILTGDTFGIVHCHPENVPGCWSWHIVISEDSGCIEIVIEDTDGGLYSSQDCFNMCVEKILTASPF